MQLADIITPERIACDTSAGSKKRALELLSELIAGGQDNMTTGEVFDSLLNRERLGGTGLGHGVAIPHGRLHSSDKTIGAFIKLEQGVDFDAIDHQPVDILFALMVPEHSTEEHLQTLAMLAAMFNDETLREKIRQTRTAQELYQLMLDWQATHH